MATLTIFANYYINSEERYLRLKDSFLSFKDIGAEKWVINVRGEHKEKVIFFLQERLGEALIATTIDTGNGWFSDTKLMLKDITSDYVLFWLEDLVNLAEVKVYKEILQEMKNSGTEAMWYSWWFFGGLRTVYRKIPKTEYEHISTFVLDKKSIKLIEPSETLNPYIIIMPSILSANLFKKIIMKKPHLLVRWHSKMNPFDFEKRESDTYWLPIKYALPKLELFAPIDDDFKLKGYSLQARGLYPTRVLRKEKAITLPKPQSKFFEAIKKIGKRILPMRFWNFLRRLKTGIILTTRGK